jgi:hypothetical protein
MNNPNDNQTEAESLVAKLMEGCKRVGIAMSNYKVTGDPSPPGQDESLQPFFILVGKIASLWSSIEVSLDLVWELAKVPAASGACITAQIGSAYLKVKALAALVSLRGGDDALLKKINRFSSEIEPAVRARNRAVHDPT